MAKQKEEKIMNTIELGLSAFSLSDQQSSSSPEELQSVAQLQACFLSGVKDASIELCVCNEKHFVYWVEDQFRLST